MFKALLLALVVGSCCFAGVIYDFDGQATYLDGSQLVSFEFSFETEAPTFITANDFGVPTTECSMQPVPPGGVDCDHINFYPDGSSHSGFTYAEVDLSGPSGGFYGWFFPLGTFDALGDYSARFFPGELEVESSPIPEPPYGLAILILGAIALCSRRLKRCLQRPHPL